MWLYLWDCESVRLQSILKIYNGPSNSWSCASPHTCWSEGKNFQIRHWNHQNLQILPNHRWNIAWFCHWVCWLLEFQVGEPKPTREALKRIVRIQRAPDMRFPHLLFLTAFLWTRMSLLWVHCSSLTCVSASPTVLMSVWEVQHVAWQLLQVLLTGGHCSNSKICGSALA